MTPLQRLQNNGPGHGGYPPLTAGVCLFIPGSCRAATCQMYKFRPPGTDVGRTGRMCLLPPDIRRSLVVQLYHRVNTSEKPRSANYSSIAHHEGLGRIFGPSYRGFGCGPRRRSGCPESRYVTYMPSFAVYSQYFIPQLKS
jgi:hypothetical protein